MATIRLDGTTNLMSHEVSVSAFAMSKYKVTNGEYLQFVRAGAKPPHFWTWREGQWYWRGMWGETPLPMDWPVYVTQEEASAFASLERKEIAHRSGVSSGSVRDVQW